MLLIFVLWDLMMVHNYARASSLGDGSFFFECVYNLLHPLAPPQLLISEKCPVLHNQLVWCTCASSHGSTRRLRRKKAEALSQGCVGTSSAATACPPPRRPHSRDISRLIRKTAFLITSGPSSRFQSDADSLCCTSFAADAQKEQIQHTHTRCISEKTRHGEPTTGWVK
jgi:hypothetical protein